MTVGTCEGCGADAYIDERRRAGVKLALCPPCQRRDIIGAWRDEYFGGRAA